jgi:excisionase family DNA binding protein
MSHPKPSVQRATAAARYIAVQGNPDPIAPLADAVVRDISNAISELGQSPALLSEINARLPALVAKALESSLTQVSSKGKALRMALIAKLASDENEMEAATGKTADKTIEASSLLSTVEAAKILNTSRPYVTMLCDAGKLGPIEVTDGGHRRIRREAVERYRVQSTTKYDDAPSVRQAGIEAGLYDHDDSHYSNVVREQDASARSAKNSKSSGKKVRP